MRWAIVGIVCLVVAAAVVWALYSLGGEDGKQSLTAYPCGVHPGNNVTSRKLGGCLLSIEDRTATTTCTGDFTAALTSDPQIPAQSNADLIIYFGDAPPRSAQRPVWWIGGPYATPAKAGTHVLGAGALASLTVHGKRLVAVPGSAYERRSHKASCPLATPPFVGSSDDPIILSYDPPRQVGPNGTDQFSGIAAGSPQLSKHLADTTLWMHHGPRRDDAAAEGAVQAIGDGLMLRIAPSGSPKLSLR